MHGSGRLQRRPSGWLRRLLRAPIFLYRVGLGQLLGHRFLLLTHRGRRSGLPRQTVLEVLRFNARTRSAVVLSATGERADWFRNILAAPPLEVQIGAYRYQPEAAGGE